MAAGVVALFPFVFPPLVRLAAGSSWALRRSIAMIYDKKKYSVSSNSMFLVFNVITKFFGVLMNSFSTVPF